jgi:chromate reductase
MTRANRPGHGVALDARHLVPLDPTSAGVRALVSWGSLRHTSINKKLALVAAHRLTALGVSVDILDLRALQLPLFDEDLEGRDGLPPGALIAKERLAASDLMVIASPEYTASVSGALKNLIDWCSRPAPPKGATCFVGKTALIMSASPGSVGGVHALAHLRDILTSLGVIVLPSQIAVARAYQVFDAHDALIDTLVYTMLDSVVGSAVRMASKLKGPATCEGEASDGGMCRYEER